MIDSDTKPKATVPFEEDFQRECFPSLVDEPLVSIVCVTYNHETFIHDALDGFLMQKATFPIEIIVHDDHSNDGTVEVLKRYAGKHKDKIVLLLRNTNIHSRGQSATYHALKHVRGKYIALCEGDDFWTDENKLQLQVDFMEQHPDFSVCCHAFFPCSISGSVGRPMPEKLKETESEADQLKRYPSYMKTGTILFRNIPDLLPSEMHKTVFRDNFIFTMLGNYGKSKYLEEIKPAGYRVHNGGIFSLTDDLQKKINRIISFYWIAVAFEKYHHDKKTAMYWRFRAARILCTATGHAIHECVMGLWIAKTALYIQIGIHFRRLKTLIRRVIGRLYGGRKPTAIIFGASNGGKNALKNLHHKYEIVAFTDNDIAKHGKKLCGRNIIAPETIKEQNADLILVCSTYRFQILEQLQKNLNYPIENIIIVSPGLVVN